MSQQAESETIVRLVNFALEQTDRLGICDILGEIAKAFGCHGAILWEPDPDIPSDSSDARLFTAGHWFARGKPFAFHDSYIERSFVGTAIRTGQMQTTNDLPADSLGSRSAASLEFYRSHEIGKYRAGPVVFVDNSVGVLTVFRRPSDPDFDAADKLLFDQCCRLLPGLHDSLYKKVSLGLINQVKDIFQSPEAVADDPQSVLLAVCKAVQECFGLLEASIFLEDPVLHHGEFRLQATTCERYINQATYTEHGPGKTSWIISRGRPIRIWDLRNSSEPREKSLIEKLHPGITWDNRDEQFKKISAELLGISKEEQVPPLSFIGEPIFSDNRVCGVLRCSTATKAPFYFTHRERELLTIVALQVGQFWTRWLDRRTVKEENKAWSRLVASIAALNYSVNAELKRQNPDILNVFRKGLEATEKMIPGGEIADIRLVDERTDELYCALIRGDAWTEEAKRIRFPVSKKPPQSVGCHVVQTGQVMVISDLQKNPYYKPIFTDAKSLLIAPIRSRNRVYGVIDIRNTRPGQFQPYAEQMAELLGQQLGLYHELIDTVSELRSAEQELMKHTGLTIQAFADWQHQIRGPVNQAYLRLREAIPLEFGGYDSAPSYVKIQRGLLRKAHRASQSLRLFVDLATGRDLALHYNRIEQSELAKLLVESCLDNRLLGSERRRIDFNVDVDSFRPLAIRGLQVDRDLLELAVNNIIDNAFKYSYRGTKIEVVGRSAGPFFCLAVSNEGITVSSEDVPHLGTRGWRAEAAESVVGEGTGIGLWVVSNIMKAHLGRLEVLPTSESRTQVRLLFPWKSSSK